MDSFTFWITLAGLVCASISAYAVSRAWSNWKIAKLGDDLRNDLQYYLFTGKVSSNLRKAMDSGMLEVVEEGGGPSQEHSLDDKKHKKGEN